MGDWNVTMMIIVLVLVVLFGVLSYFTLKMDDMEIKTIRFKVLKGITFTATVVVGFALILLVRHNTDMIMNMLQK